MSYEDRIKRRIKELRRRILFPIRFIEGYPTEEKPPEPKPEEDMAILVYGVNTRTVPASVLYSPPWFLSPAWTFSPDIGNMGEANNSMPITRNGKLQKLRVNVSNNGNASPISISVSVNGVITPLQTTIPGNATGLFSNDTDVIVNANDLVACRLDTTLSEMPAIKLIVSVEFVPI